jgi:hypothetical protein
MSEGKTDNRFLKNVVKRSFDEIGFECNSEVETVIIPIEIEESDLSFVEKVTKASKKGTEKFGIMILCIHADADAPDEEQTMKNKIDPANCALLSTFGSDLCKILVAVIPVQMIEAWMLADKELLKREIGTNKNDHELGIHRHPELIADPKFTIQEAIRIARAELTKRRRYNLSISELYLPLGQKIAIEKLDILPSFQKFKNSIRDAYRKLNYMQ